MGVFDHIVSGLAAQDSPLDTLMINATHLKAHRTAASLLKGGACAPYRRANQGGLKTRLHGRV